MRKVVNLFFVCCVLVSFSGCASLKGNTPFEYQPSLVSSTKTIDKVVGVNMLVDKRPEKDIKYTKVIKDVNEKVTAKLIEDFKASNLFSEIHYPAREGDDLIINGTLDRFKWKMYAKPLAYVPYIGLFAMLVGYEGNEAYGIAGVTIEVKDNNTGSIVTTISKHAEIHNAYSMYNFSAGDAGAELADALRTVAKEIKVDLQSNF